jgi:hypothetical protein
VDTKATVRPPGETDGAGQHLGRLHPLVDEHQDLAVSSQHAGKLGRRRLVGDEPDRRLVRRERRLGVAVIPQRPAEPLLRDPLAHGVPTGERGDRIPAERHRAPAVARKPGCLRDPVEQGGTIHAGDRVGVVHGGPLLERPLAVPLGIGKGVGRGGRIRGAHGCLERPADVARRREVPRKLRPVAGGRRAGSGPSGRQHRSERAVEALPLAGQQVVVGRLLEKRVAEGVVAFGALAGAR